MMLRLSFIGAAAVAGLLSLSMANAESVSDNTSSSYWARDVFAKTLRDQTAISDQTQWPDVSALSYAKSARSRPPTATWLPQPMPAVDGINAKIDGYGGGANHARVPNNLARISIAKHPRVTIFEGLNGAL